VKILFSFVLSLLMLNRVHGVKWSGYFFDVNLEEGQTFHISNDKYPNNTWKLYSLFIIEATCFIDLNDNCIANKFLVINENSTSIYCDNDTIAFEGFNLTIKFVSAFQSRFLCEIKTNINNNTCQCGQKKMTRTVDGEVTKVNEYPYIVGLATATNKTIFCGATIISNRHILTAAHCFRITNRVIGEYDVTTENTLRIDDNTKGTKVYQLIKCIIHPGYRRNKSACINDIAVCKINKNIEYTAEIGPVCLPFKHKDDSFIGDTVTALGWNLRDFGKKAIKLQKVDLNVEPLKNCPNSNDNNICTFTPGNDTYQMDGGPLLWKNPVTDDIVLVGIISSGYSSGTPTANMRIGTYIDWIVSVTPGKSR
ncbi:SP34 protease, partial [Acromyrmex charruanus]